jgi:AcrR family transcriptional regulator
VTRSCAIRARYCVRGDQEGPPRGCPRSATYVRRCRPRDERLDAAILDATVRLLEERGYRDLALTAVAESAGTTTAAIYRRWTSKSDLVMHAVFRTSGDDVVADTGDLASDLATMVRWSVEKLGRPAALAALVGLLSESAPQRLARAGDAAVASARTGDRIERAKAAGEIRADIDTSVLVALIAGPVLQMALRGAAREIDEAWIASHVGVVLDGARAPGRPHRRSDSPNRRKVTQR